jgi:transcription elongation GreA/GreB family factor
MDKQALYRQLLQEIGGRIERIERSAKDAHAEATHEQNKAENKYDTRGLEASYLAEGQTLQAAELEQNFLQLQALQIRMFESDESVQLGALIELGGSSEKVWYFIAPCAGGTELKSDNQTVLVLTPHSPLGALLIGKRKGDKITLQIRREKTHYLLAAIQ